MLLARRIKAGHECSSLFRIQRSIAELTRGELKRNHRKGSYTHKKYLFEPPNCHFINSNDTTCRYDGYDSHIRQLNRGVIDTVKLSKTLLTERPNPKSGLAPVSTISPFGLANAVANLTTYSVDETLNLLGFNFNISGSDGQPQIKNNQFARDLIASYMDYYGFSEEIQFPYEREIEYLDLDSNYPFMADSNTVIELGHRIYATFYKGQLIQAPIGLTALDAHLPITRVWTQSDDRLPNISRMLVRTTVEDTESHYCETREHSDWLHRKMDALLPYGFHTTRMSNSFQLDNSGEMEVKVTATYIPGQDDDEGRPLVVLSKEGRCRSPINSMFSQQEITTDFNREPLLFEERINDAFLYLSSLCVPHSRNLTESQTFRIGDGKIEFDPIEFLAVGKVRLRSRRLGSRTLTRAEIGYRGLLRMLDCSNVSYRRPCGYKRSALFKGPGRLD